MSPPWSAVSCRWSGAWWCATQGGAQRSAGARLARVTLPGRWLIRTIAAVFDPEQARQSSGSRLVCRGQQKSPDQLIERPRWRRPSPVGAGPAQQLSVGPLFSSLLDTEPGPARHGAIGQRLYKALEDLVRPEFLNRPEGKSSLRNSAKSACGSGGRRQRHFPHREGEGGPEPARADPLRIHRRRTPPPS